MKLLFKSVTLIFFVAIVVLYASTYLPFPREVLKINEAPNQSLLIKDRYGNLLREVPTKEGLRARWVTLEEISPHLVDATIYAEDKRFYSHPGIDPAAMARSAWLNLAHGTIVAGGSTLTQQVVRNLFHYPRSFKNKLLELWYALRLEHTLSKKEILTLYLNIAPYGNQVAGVEAASRIYLTKPAAHLSLGEAAFLAALPQSPSTLNPYRNKEDLLKRRKVILNRMLQAKTIAEEEYQAALESMPSLYRPDSPYKAPHFVDWVVSTLPSETRDKGGEVITTLDLPLQEKAVHLLKKRLLALKKEHVTNGSIIILNNMTGDILAMVGSRDYFDSNEGQVNGALALRQPGSSIKPFMYSLALERNYAPSTVLADVETLISSGPWGDFVPMNYDNQYHGPVSLRVALASSYNIPAVRTLQEVGVNDFLVRLRNLGFEHLTHSAEYYGPGLTLGDGEVTLLELAGGYRALANGGLYTKERMLLQQRIDAPRRVIAPDVAYLLTDILSDPRARTPAFGRNGPLEMGMAVAAKTGTTSDFRDNWAMGFSREYTVGVWVGNFDGSSMEGVSGISGAAPLLRDIFFELYKDHLPEPFEMPKNIVSREVCALSGELPGPACKHRRLELFIQGKEPTKHCSYHKLLAIDIRNGFLVGPDTPPDQVEEKVYEIYPPLFRSWAATHGIPVPPEKISADDHGAPLQILFPRNGDIFHIDPNLPLSQQALPLKALVGLNINKISWKI